jgi:hypothetical protein
MEKLIQYENAKITDWSKYVTLTPEQRNKLIQEKIERAKIQYLAMQKLHFKVTQ